MVSEAKRKRLEALSGRLIQSGPLQSTHKRLRGAQSSADQSPSAAWPYAKLQEEDFPAAVRPTSKPGPRSAAEGLLQSAAEARQKPLPLAAAAFQERALLLDNPAPVKAHRRRSSLGRLPRMLASRKRLVKLGLDVTQQGHCRFSDAERLHLLWLGYAEKMLAVQQPVAAAASMLNLHGCRCTVVRSKNVQHAGVHGIIIRVSGSMWHILQENDVCQHVDRRECDINFCIAPHSITLLAGQAQLNPTAL